MAATLAGRGKSRADSDPLGEFSNLRHNLLYAPIWRIFAGAERVDERL